MTKRFDLAVVGAGPAGLMVARTAAPNGLSVALLERKTDIPRVARRDGGAIGINKIPVWSDDPLQPGDKSLLLFHLRFFRSMPQSLKHYLRLPDLFCRERTLKAVKSRSQKIKI